MIVRCFGNIYNLETAEAIRVEPNTSPKVNPDPFALVMVMPQDYIVVCYGTQEAMSSWLELIWNTWATTEPGVRPFVDMDTEA